MFCDSVFLKSKSMTGANNKKRERYAKDGEMVTEKPRQKSQRNNGAKKSQKDREGRGE